MEKSEIARPISTILDGDIVKPTKQDKEDHGKFIERLEEWDSKNHQIITWLSNTSIPAIHIQFDAFENAKELWDFLSTRFKFVGLAHYYQLHNNLVNLNQEAGQSVNEYLAVLQPIWTQLD
ncbi:Copia protein [Cucumis melo var. makuwa]|uniref:Copia protein n=1 Tax=Cucumis melo var. makuwa TaxID=1194695 RepID=A0A5D3BGE0_CUCMM|nr:Copia protein [Cucumis melo var. makuwa]TYJ98154.1 Copia protein [Cucumis melo var. makuwa]